jgi:hypothetical protein
MRRMGLGGGEGVMEGGGMCRRDVYKGGEMVLRSKVGWAGKLINLFDIIRRFLKAMWSSRERSFSGEGYSLTIFEIREFGPNCNIRNK